MRATSIAARRGDETQLRYIADRPKDIRRATPWHRYGHHIRTLPARLEALSHDLAVPPGGRVLDYGCAEVPYRGFFAADVDYVAADLPGNPHATLVLDEDGTIPLPDDSFDAVMSTQVLEHVTDPAGYLAECFRVLRPGGRLLLSTHGIFIYHPDPVDLWRWTSGGMRTSSSRPASRSCASRGSSACWPRGSSSCRTPSTGACRARCAPCSR